mmetsp:Transcript_15417/g.36294  ORF Transcript_15417/g.36294 Transcript_15417/m.36294 type:complete len:281 (+) Transcript_15417:991-1833(+)
MTRVQEGTLRSQTPTAVPIRSLRQCLGLRPGRITRQNRRGIRIPLRWWRISAGPPRLRGRATGLPGPLRPLHRLARQRRRCSQPSGTARHARWKTTRTGPTAARATLRNQRPPPSKSTSGMARRFRSRAPWRTRAPGPCPLTRNSRTSRRPRPPATSSSTSPRTTGPMPLLPMPASDSATLLRPRPTPTPLPLQAWGLRESASTSLPARPGKPRPLLRPPRSRLPHRPGRTPKRLRLRTLRTRASRQATPTLTKEVLGDCLRLPVHPPTRSPRSKWRRIA